MTLEEKFWQLFMIPGDLDDSAHDYSHGIFGLQVSFSDTSPDAVRADARRINAIQRYFVERTRLGIPIIPFEEAVHGLRRPGGTMFPQAIALAATWDTALVGRVAAAIARETGSRGIRQVLSPVLNLARDVRWGRVEETYGEDPYLASAMGRAYVGALERAEIVTTPKHFVANVGDGGRDSYPIDYDERLLAETDADFQQLVAAKRRFIIPATIFFIVYYFALPVLVGYFPGLMDVNMIGNINLAYLFALSQFFMAWIIAGLYIGRAGNYDKMAAAIIKKVRGGRK